MPRVYAFSESTIQSYDSYDLTLNDDGTFELGCGSSDPAGAMGWWNVEGTWTQTGTDIRLTARTRQRSYDMDPLEYTGTYAVRVDGEDLDVEGIGRFWPTKSL